MLRVLCAILLIVGSGANDCFAGAQARGWVIELPNRSLRIDEPGVEPALLQALQSAGELPVLAIVLLEKTASATMRGRLQDHGIALDTYLGQQAYYATIARDTEPQDWPPFVLWAGKLAPVDKLEPALWQRAYAPWAVTAAGRIKILVSFRRGTPQQAIQQILSACCVAYRPHADDGEWRAQIHPDAIEALASDPHVRAIEQGPHPMQPLGRIDARSVAI